MIVHRVLLFWWSVAFYNSIFFKVKMLMLLLAGLNVWLFNATVGRKMAEWDIDSVTPGSAKPRQSFSCCLVAIVAAGRAIAILCRRRKGFT